MHFDKSTLCVTKVKSCTKLCANINKKEHFSFVLHTFCLHFVKEGEDKKKEIKDTNLLKVHVLTAFYLT